LEKALNFISKSNERPDRVGQSDTVTYTLTLKNTGNIEVDNINVFLNSCTQKLYEPGSVFKPVIIYGQR